MLNAPLKNRCRIWKINLCIWEIYPCIWKINCCVSETLYVVVFSENVDDGLMKGFGASPIQLFLQKTSISHNFNLKTSVCKEKDGFITVLRAQNPCKSYLCVLFANFLRIHWIVLSVSVVFSPLCELR